MDYGLSSCIQQFQYHCEGVEKGKKTGRTFIDSTLNLFNKRSG